jgi:hypothetical protein
MKTEKQVKDEIKKYLKSRGAYFFMPVQFGYGAATLDFLVCLNGRFVGIEAKKEGKAECTPRQRQTILDIKNAGGIAFIADRLETVKAYLD